MRFPVGSVDNVTRNAIYLRCCGDRQLILFKQTILSPFFCTGIIHSIDAMKCAIVTSKLGAGRSKAGESVNFTVGLEIMIHVGQAVKEGKIHIVLAN